MSIYYEAEHARGSICTSLNETTLVSNQYPMRSV